MNDTDVLIKIVTAYEAGGIEAAKKAANELKTAVDANSSAGKTLSGALDLLNGKGQNAGQVFNGLRGILQGGQGAATGFANVVKGLGGALGMAAGPLAILTTGIGLAVSAWQSYKQKQEEAAKAAAEAAEKEKAAAEEAAKALEERLAGAADRAREKIKAISQEFLDAAKASKEMDDALASLGDAQLGLELAEIDKKIATASPEEKATLEQQKVELKEANENKKAQVKQKQLQAQIDALDAADKAAEEEAGKAHAAWLNNDDFQALVAAREEKEKAETFLAGAKSRLPSGEEWSDEVEEGDAWVYAASKNAEKLENKFGAAEAEAAANDEAAKKAYEKTLADNAQQKQILQAQIDAITISRQAGAVQASTSIAKIQQDYEASKPKSVETEEPPPAPPSVRDLWNDASGQIQRGQVYKGQHYDIDNGQIQQKARQALSNAGRIMAEGKSGDDAQVIADLVSALEEMGARIADRNKMLQDLQAAVSLMRQQAKRQRS